MVIEKNKFVQSFLVCYSLIDIDLPGKQSVDSLVKFLKKKKRKNNMSRSLIIIKITLKLLANKATCAHQRWGREY